MVKPDASIYCFYIPFANSTKQSLSSIVQDIDTLHVAKICQALPSTDNLASPGLTLQLLQNQWLMIFPDVSISLMHVDATHLLLRGFPTSIDILR
jgi:hypothetical protein